MKYECHLGGFTYWVDAGNPIQACMETLKECIDQHNTFARLPFLVLNLETGKESRVGMSEVLEWMALAAEELPEK